MFMYVYGIDVDKLVCMWAIAGVESSYQRYLIPYTCGLTRYLLPTRLPAIKKLSFKDVEFT